MSSGVSGGSPSGTKTYPSRNSGCSVTESFPRVRRVLPTKILRIIEGGNPPSCFARPPPPPQPHLPYAPSPYPPGPPPPHINPYGPQPPPPNNLPPRMNFPPPPPCCFPMCPPCPPPCGGNRQMICMPRFPGSGPPIYNNCNFYGAPPCPPSNPCARAPPPPPPCCPPPQCRPPCPPRCLPLCVRRTPCRPKPATSCDSIDFDRYRREQARGKPSRTIRVELSEPSTPSSNQAQGKPRQKRRSGGSSSVRHECNSACKECMEKYIDEQLRLRLKELGISGCPCDGGHKKGRTSDTNRGQQDDRVPGRHDSPRNHDKYPPRPNGRDTSYKSGRPSADDSTQYSYEPTRSTTRGSTDRNATPSTPQPHGRSDGPSASSVHVLHKNPSFSNDGPPRNQRPGDHVPSSRSTIRSPTDRNGTTHSNQPSHGQSNNVTPSRSAVPASYYDQTPDDHHHPSNATPSRSNTAWTPIDQDGTPSNYPSHGPKGTPSRSAVPGSDDGSSSDDDSPSYDDSSSDENTPSYDDSSSDDGPHSTHPNHPHRNNVPPSRSAVPIPIDQDNDPSYYTNQRGPPPPPRSTVPSLHDYHSPDEDIPDRRNTTPSRSTVRPPIDDDDTPSSPLSQRPKPTPSRSTVRDFNDDDDTPPNRPSHGQPTTPSRSAVRFSNDPDRPDGDIHSYHPSHSQRGSATPSKTSVPVSYDNHGYGDDDLHPTHNPRGRNSVPDDLHSTHSPRGRDSVPDDLHSTHSPRGSDSVPDDLHSTHSPRGRDSVPPSPPPRVSYDNHGFDPPGSRTSSHVPENGEPYDNQPPPQPYAHSPFGGRRLRCPPLARRNNRVSCGNQTPFGYRHPLHDGMTNTDPHQNNYDRRYPRRSCNEGYANTDGPYDAGTSMYDTDPNAPRNTAGMQTNPIDCTGVGVNAHLEPRTRHHLNMHPVGAGNAHLNPPMRHHVNMHPVDAGTNPDRMQFPTRTGRGPQQRPRPQQCCRPQPPCAIQCQPKYLMKPSFNKVDRVIVDKESLEDKRRRHIKVFRRHCPHKFIPNPNYIPPQGGENPGCVDPENGRGSKKRSSGPNRKRKMPPPRHQDDSPPGSSQSSETMKVSGSSSSSESYSYSYSSSSSDLVAPKHERQ